MIIDFRNMNGGSGSGGTTNYNELSNKPQINGVVLSGNKSSADLGISGGTSDYLELSNKPSINGIELDGNLTSDDLNLAIDKVKEVEAVTVLPTVAKDGSVFAYSQPNTVFGWENIGYDADNRFKAEFVFKQMPDVSDMPITLGTANVTGSLDETISQDLVLLNDFFDGVMVQVGNENYMRKGQSSEFWYHGDNDLKCVYDWTNEALLKFTIYENGTSQTKSGATITNQVDSEYVSINSLVQANGVDASGNTIYTKVGADGMHLHWYAYSDGHFMYAREKCTNDGDYLVHQGAEIEGSRTYAGVRISGGTIVEAPYSGVDNIGDGHWAGSKEDANGVSYFFHCWVEGSYLYWQTSSPIMMLDAYGTGSDYQGGLMYGGETGTDSSISQIRFTNLDLAAMSIGDTTQVVVAMPDMEFGKQYLRASTGATSGVSFGASIDDFANVVTIPSYVFTLTKVTGNTLGWDMFTLTPSDTVNFTKLSWYCNDSNTPYPLSLVSNFNNYTLTFQNGKVKLIGSWVNSDQSTSFSRQFASYIESQQQLKYNPYKNGDIEFIIYKVPTA